jgi:putative transposase
MPAAASVDSMPRRPRHQEPGAIYHVTSRGTEGRPIFLDDLDRELFLTELAEVVEAHRWMCPAYCLMTNHFHVLVQTPEPDLAEGMHGLNGIYANYFNRRHNHVGHLLQSRYKSTLIEADAHLLESSRYVVLNPVRAGLCGRAGYWRWSSYRATAGYVEAPPFLAVDWVRSQFGSDPRRAVVRYVEFVADGLRQGLNGLVQGPGPWTRPLARVEDELDPLRRARRREGALPFSERHDLGQERVELDTAVGDELQRLLPRRRRAGKA